MIGLSTFLSADFTKNGDVVTDSKTGLAWQDDAIGSQMSWQSAIDYCEALTLDTYEDWRMPNINELKSIVDRSKGEPAIVDGFENIGTNSFYRYWSSTTSIVGIEYYYAWIVNFNYGYVLGSSKDNYYYVCCVRDGQ